MRLAEKLTHEFYVISTTKRKVRLYKIPIFTHPDPESGHPTKYVRDSIPEIKSYPGGATTPTPKAISFKPGKLLADETGAFGSSRGWKAWGIKW